LVGTGAGRLDVVAPSSSTGAVVSRLLAVAMLVLAVAVIVGLGAYARGRGSVDQDALQARAFEAGQTAGRNEAQRRAAKGASSRRAVPRRSSSSAVVTGPSAEMRAQLRRAFAAGASSAAVNQRAHGRALGAAAVLGNFGGGWATGRWYMVRLAPGSTLTGGHPRLAARVGPIANGQGYTACQGGGSVCPVRRG
jgi:hypothetical protein